MSAEKEASDEGEGRPGEEGMEVDQGEGRSGKEGRSVSGEGKGRFGTEGNTVGVRMGTVGI